MTDENPLLSNVDTRTREERKLDLLRDWLVCPQWCLGPGPNMLAGYSEAVCLLVGIDPELSQFSEGEGFHWTFLPGTLSNYGYEEVPTDDGRFFNLEEHILFDLNRVAGLKRLGAHRVDVIIDHALERGVTIPWLEIAKSDRECAERLPRSAFKDDDFRGFVHGESAISISSRKKANNMWAIDKKTKLINELGRPIFEKWFNDPKISRCTKAALARRILEELCKQFPDTPDPRTSRTIENHIRKWIYEKAQS